MDASSGEDNGQSLSMYGHTYIGLTSKNISITEEAYDALEREKRKDESFTEAILRLTRKRGKLSDCFGTWRTTDAEQLAIERELRRGWKRTSERILNEVP